MGGVNQNSSSKDLFRNTCHQGLLDCQFDQNSKTLCKVVKAQKSILDWYNDISRLQDKKHLFIPIKITHNQQFFDQGCCVQQNDLRAQVQFKKVYYPVFYYTLQKEILSRIQKRYHFRQQQLWKLMIYISKACIQWQQTYPNQSVGVICPQNVIMSTSGQVKLVCKISFYQQVYGSDNKYYYAPELSAKSIIKNSLNPNSDPLAVESASVYSLGAVLLQLSNLVPSSQEIALLQRQNLLRSMLYSAQLKYAIEIMIKENPVDRPRLTHILKNAKLNRSKYL